MPLIILITIGVALYSAMLVLLSRASGKIDPYWSTTIFGVTSTITPFVLWLIDRQARKPQLPTGASGLAYSLAAGVMAGLFTATLIRIYAKGGVSYANPVIYGGAIALTSLIGWSLFKESVSGMQVAGIALTLAGVALVVFSKMQGAAS